MPGCWELYQDTLSAQHSKNVTVNFIAYEILHLCIDRRYCTFREKPSMPPKITMLYLKITENISSLWLNTVTKKACFSCIMNFCKKGQGLIEEAKFLQSLQEDAADLLSLCVESFISSAIICWGSSIRTTDLKRLNSLIKKSGSVLGTNVEPLEILVQRRILLQ